ncbi:hypothetical protein BXZ70DRAFT_920999 [Cristinia sonorae]|uniref:Protein phosphatase n=1 Tax=Cristinia sonorae TaxID=1940300 RepID=A0A8K0UXU5_9AGAR|nr:hypothetical protein BXZ70DRAFT_920999 [Cristinia sonorae]
MKPIHKRLYTALPRPPPPAASSLASSASAPLSSRVRSNSVSSNCSTSSTSTSRSLHTNASSLPFSFFDTPPPPPNPSSRPTNIIVSSRPPVKAEAESPTPNNATYSHQHQSSGQPPYPLALSSSQSDATSSHIPTNTNHTLFFPYPSFGTSASLDSTPTSHIDTARAQAHHNTRYQLDVGAYGIPKHSRDVRKAGSDGRSSLSFAGGLQIPVSMEANSAVQVGEDAYFVRDNAMGVADGVGGWSKTHRTATNESTPSALFAQRLMHYCSEEVDAALETESTVFEDDLHDQLNESLEDLADGLDVLMILERAYDKTMRAHVKQPDTSCGDSVGDERVVRPASPTSAGSTRSTTPNATLNSSSLKSTPHPPQPVPLLEGSATALLAVLDHSHVSPLPAQKASSHTTAPSSFLFPRPRTGFTYPQPLRGKAIHARSQEESRGGGAVIRIAHLGDCMGMLIRGEDIVWRTEEMWWNFNTPVQLGPSSSTRPQDAKVFTIPVEADDILVLASDGLSDNLWDEDILDEVVRFRRGFMDKEHRSISTTTMHSESHGILGRRTLAGMLSEALCSRARSVSERRGRATKSSTTRMFASAPSTSPSPLKSMLLDDSSIGCASSDEVPFARRAREHGKCFRGGKPDDISVLIAVVSPSQNTSKA